MQDLSWRRLLQGHVSQEMLKFVVNAQMLTLPTDDDLRRWGKLRMDSVCRATLTRADGSVLRCTQSNATLLHVLAGSKVARLQGRTKWRHDSVLHVLGQQLSAQLDKLNSGASTAQSSGQVQFVRAGGKKYEPRGQARQATGIGLRGLLAAAHDWKMLIDLEGDECCYAVFPAHITETIRKPDVLLISENTRVVVRLELTSPMEENVVERHADKERKYLEATAGSGSRQSVATGGDCVRGWMSGQRRAHNIASTARSGVQQDAGCGNQAADVERRATVQFHVVPKSEASIVAQTSTDVWHRRRRRATDV